MANNMFRAAVILIFNVAFLATACLGLRGAPAPTHTGPDMLAYNASLVQAAKFQQSEAVIAHTIATLSTAHHCTPVTVWVKAHPHTVPVSMIVKRDHTASVTVIPWTYPAPAGQWTEALCSR